MGVKNAGRPEIAGSTSMAVRRSESEPISQMRHGDHVGGKGHGLGVKIAAGEHFVVASSVRGKNKRIVGYAVRLDPQGLGRLPQHVEHRPHHLRLTSQTVRVLHPSIVCQVRGADRRAGHEPPYRGGRLDLAAVAAELVDAGVEWRVRTLGRLGRQSTRNECIMNRRSASNSPASA